MRIGTSDPLERALAPLPSDDLLCDILSALKVESSTLSLFDLGEPWGFTLDYLPFSSSWTIMEGAVCMTTPGGEQIEYHAGDTFLLPRGIRQKSYVLASSASVKPVSAVELWREAELEGFKPGDPSRRTQHVRWGGGGDVTRVVATAFSFNDCKFGPIINDLPELMVVRSTETHGEGRFINSLLQFGVDGEDAVRPGFAPLAAQISQLLLLLVVRAYALSSERGGFGSLAGLNDPQIGRALQCIHRQPASTWTVASLARSAGLSRSLFAERFLSKTGKTPMHYLRDWRMHLACEALSSSNIPINVLACSLGYQSEAAFRSAFRATVGRSPKEFRRYAETQNVMELAKDIGIIWNIGQ